jgi:hypothetical protein
VAPIDQLTNQWIREKSGTLKSSIPDQFREIDSRSVNTKSSELKFPPITRHKEPIIPPSFANQKQMAEKVEEVLVERAQNIYACKMDEITSIEKSANLNRDFQTVNAITSVLPPVKPYSQLFSFALTGQQVMNEGNKKLESIACEKVADLDYRNRVDKINSAHDRSSFMIPDLRQSISVSRPEGGEQFIETRFNKDKELQEKKNLGGLFQLGFSFAPKFIIDVSSIVSNKYSSAVQFIAGASVIGGGKYSKDLNSSIAETERQKAKQLHDSSIDQAQKVNLTLQEKTSFERPQKFFEVSKK